MTALVATAPGKLILTGEYAVLDGAPAVVIAVDRRVTARVGAHAVAAPSEFLAAVIRELVMRFGETCPSVAVARAIVVDSRAFFADQRKLGLGSSAAVTVAATARALAERGPMLDRAEVFALAMAAHAAAQGARGARGSGADIAAAVHGGAIVFTAGVATPHRWPAGVTILPFFTGDSADTATLVAQVAAARAARPAEVSAALAAIAAASAAASLALAGSSALAAIAGPALLAALRLAAAAIERLALATRVALVPPCVTAARAAMVGLGGTAKTTGAGGGDVAIAVIPTTADATEARRLLIQCGCQPLALTLDETGVDLRPDAQ